MSIIARSSTNVQVEISERYPVHRTLTSETRIRTSLIEEVL